MDLTNQERKLAELSVKKYNRLFYRKNQLFGWVGVALFSVGLLKIFPLPVWCYEIFTVVGFTLIMLSGFALVMTVIGKLYKQVQEHEQNLKENVRTISNEK